MMKIGELKNIVDSIHELHGPNANALFVYQRASGRTGVGSITSYRVSVGIMPSIHFAIEYPRGEKGPE